MANKYTDEYRREAVDYVLNSGKSIKECARELGLNDKTLSHWVSNMRKCLDRGMKYKCALKATARKRMKVIFEGAISRCATPRDDSLSSTPPRYYTRSSISSKRVTPQ